MAMIRASMLDMYYSLKEARKIFTEESAERTGINDILSWMDLGDTKMGQLGGYNHLQNAMQQQQLEQRSAYLQALMGQSQQGFGQLGQLGAAQYNQALNVQESLYPGKIIHSDYQNYLKVAVKVAMDHDFEYNDTTNSFIHKNGGYVTRKQLEGTEIKYLPRIFIKTKTPNISWLDDRIEEVRVKLC